MSDDLYRLLSTGLLGVIVLLLVVAVAQLARMKKSLEPSKAPVADTAERSGVAPPDDIGGHVPEALVEEPEPVVEAVPAQTIESPAEASGSPAAAPEVEEEEGPFERDGRWWFRRGDELLVYDETLEEWVGAQTETPATAVEPAAFAESPAPVTEVQPIEPHPLEEARGWDTRPAESAAPIPEPVSAPASIVEPSSDATEDTADQPAPAPSHWKCPSCGVINGSTATTCRMCFTARP